MVWKVILWLFLVIFAISGAKAQEHFHPPQDAELHANFYSTWNMPNGGQPRKNSCCNLQDCYPTTIKKVDNQWYALRREDGQWLRVQEGLLEHNQSDPRESPDHQSHACISPPQKGNNVYCAVLGSGL